MFEKNSQKMWLISWIMNLLGNHLSFVTKLLATVKKRTPICHMEILLCSSVIVLCSFFPQFEKHVGHSKIKITLQQTYMSTFPWRHFVKRKVFFAVLLVGFEKC